METLPAAKFVDVQGRAVPLAGELRLLACLKGTAASPQRFYRASDGRREWALKIHQPRRLTQRLRATFGRSPLDQEAAMLLLAAERGLPVPRLVGIGREKRASLVVQTALLIEWLPERQTLFDLARQAGDKKILDEAQSVLANFLVRVRRAALADRDFGAHNLVVPRGTAASPIWVDLEGAFAAEPDDAPATCRTVGAALANWWCVCGGDQARLAALLKAIRAELPSPVHGWPALAEALNAIIAARVGKAIQFGWAEGLPARLEL